MTNHDELCEKVFEEYEHDNPDEVRVIKRMRNWLKKALTSGLLCDGKELEESRLIVAEHMRISSEAKGKMKYLQQDATVGNNLCHILSRYAGESGQSEGAVEVLERKLDEISSLKLKLEVAEKEIEKLKEDWSETLHERDELKSKLSGSCEGMTEEQIREAVCRFEDKYYEETGRNLPITGLVDCIHAQMTGGKK